ncbi:hypothetical protein P3T27_002777 [Kitasatospora sp. MAA19]|nr:hypothetical protein [Kitasatospora sp. MAA19]
MTADVARRAARPTPARLSGRGKGGRALRVLPSRKTENGEPK